MLAADLQSQPRIRPGGATEPPLYVAAAAGYSQREDDALGRSPQEPGYAFDVSDRGTAAPPAPALAASPPPPRGNGGGGSGLPPPPPLPHATPSAALSPGSPWEQGLQWGGVSMGESGLFEAPAHRPWYYIAAFEWARPMRIRKHPKYRAPGDEQFLPTFQVRLQRRSALRRDERTCTRLLPGAPHTKLTAPSPPSSLSPSLPSSLPPSHPTRSPLRSWSERLLLSKVCASTFFASPMGAGGSWTSAAPHRRRRRVSEHLSRRRAPRLDVVA